MIDLPIKNKQLYELAFTHRSYLNENQDNKEHNERLEFLGDAVLEMATSEFLYQQYPTVAEGELTAYRASLVKTSSLAEASITLGFGAALKLSKGEEMSGGRQNPSLMADTFEAVIGAIYLDQGYKTAYTFLSTHLFPHIKNIIDQKLYKDFKSSLQELVQSKGSQSPEYHVLDESGPDHSKTFVISVSVNGKQLATGEGRSKQEGQQSAAKHALEKQGKA